MTAQWGGSSTGSSSARYSRIKSFSESLLWPIAEHVPPEWTTATMMSLIAS